MIIDSHCHTHCSDGSVSIVERIEMIKRLNKDVATITDHDFISPKSVSIAQEACDGMTFIPGIELTSHYNGCLVHVLGYFVDPSSTDLTQHIEELDYLDSVKTTKMLFALEKRGIKITLDELVNNPIHTTYYLNLIKVLAKKLHNDSALVFDHYMGSMKESGNDWITFVDCSVAKAIDIIHSSGGIAVLAHPGYGNDQMMKNLGFLYNTEETISHFCKMGLDGVETHCPSHSLDENLYYASIAKELNLLQTEGSDCHGDDDYLGPSLMESFTQEFDDGYERLLRAYRKRYRKEWGGLW